MLLLGVLILFGVSRPDRLAYRVPLAGASDTALAHEIDWGRSLSRVLTGVGALVSEGFDSAAVARIEKEVLNLTPEWAVDANKQQTTASYMYRVRFRGRLSNLSIRIKAAEEFGYIDVLFQSPDSLLIAAIRPAIRAAYLASLGPITRVTLAVGELRQSAVGPPGITLMMKTVNEYGCLGYWIESSLDRNGDTLRLHLLGVSAPKGPCPDMMGPAELRQRLFPLPAGRYRLIVDYRGKTDQFRLRVTDTSTALVTERSTFVKADERLRWRYPPNSFALFCTPRELCEEVDRWLIGQRGIVRMHFSQNGLNPFSEKSDGGTDAPRVFRYETEEFLDVARICFESIGNRIREHAAVGLRIRSWTGEQASASSGGSYRKDRLPLPETLTSSPACRGHPR